MELRTVASIDPQSSTDSRLYIDQYQPTGPQELAVHSKKVSEVREWLNSALITKTQVPIVFTAGRRELNYD